MGEDEIFQQYHISSNWKLLDEIKERSPCPLCHKSRKYFCYTCYVPVSAIKGIIPRVSLPLKIDIIKHKREIDGKSTSAHAALLAPEDVTILQYPEDLSAFTYDSQTILIYPGKPSYSLTEYFERNPIRIRSVEDQKNDSLEKGTILLNNRQFKLPFNRAVFIDGTWNQSKAMYGCLKDLPCAVLQSRLSQFWRHQKKSPRWYLATIEAIHQLFTEIYDHCSDMVDGSPEPRHFDNLLFFFRYMYHIIHTHYDHNSLLSYRRPLNL